MNRQWLRLVLGGLCYIVLLVAMDIIFAALEGDVLDHPIADLIEIVVTILLPSFLVVVAFSLVTWQEQLTVGIVAAGWKLIEALLFQAKFNRGADASQTGGLDAVAGIVHALLFLSIAIGPWAIGRMRR